MCVADTIRRDDSYRDTPFMMHLRKILNLDLDEDGMVWKDISANHSYNPTFNGKEKERAPPDWPDKTAFRKPVKIKITHLKDTDKDNSTDEDNSQEENPEPTKKKARP